MERGKDEIARRLRMTRAVFDLTQGAFAAKAGLTASTYNRYERATRVPAIEQAIELCEAYGLTLDWIYRGVPDGLPLHTCWRLAAEPVVTISVARRISRLKAAPAAVVLTNGR